MKIRITGCSDSLYWYNGLVGEVYETTKEDDSVLPHVYWVRDTDGFRNIVDKRDAVHYDEQDTAVNEPAFNALALDNSNDISGAKPVFEEIAAKRKKPEVKTSDGSTAEYYELPAKATQLQHLISAKDMNAQIGEVFRTCYRYGECSHSDKLREAKKIAFYAAAEIERLET